MDGLRYTALFCGCTHGLMQRSATIQGLGYEQPVLIMSPHQERHHTESQSELYVPDSWGRHLFDQD